MTVDVTTCNVNVMPEWRGCEVVKVVFKPFSYFTLWPLSEVRVWAICEKFDESASGWMTKLYPNQKPPYGIGCFVSVDWVRIRMLHWVGWPNFIRTRPNLIESAVSFSFIYFWLLVWFLLESFTESGIQDLHELDQGPVLIKYV